MERDCAGSQSQQHFRLAATPKLLRLVLRTQPRSGLPAKFTNNAWMRVLVKSATSWVKVPPVELDGSRPKRGIRDEAVKPNH